MHIAALAVHPAATVDTPFTSAHSCRFRVRISTTFRRSPPSYQDVDNLRFKARRSTPESRYHSRKLWSTPSHSQKRLTSSSPTLSCILQHRRLQISILPVPSRSYSQTHLYPPPHLLLSTPSSSLEDRLARSTLISQSSRGLTKLPASLWLWNDFALSLPKFLQNTRFRHQWSLSSTEPQLYSQIVGRMHPHGDRSHIIHFSSIIWSSPQLLQRSGLTIYLFRLAASFRPPRQTLLLLLRLQRPHWILVDRQQSHAACLPLYRSLAPWTHSRLVTLWTSAALETKRPPRSARSSQSLSNYQLLAQNR